MKVYRSELKFSTKEDPNGFTNSDMMETPNLINIFTHYFLELFIYLSKPIVDTYSNALYQ